MNNLKLKDNKTKVLILVVTAIILITIIIVVALSKNSKKEVVEEDKIANESTIILDKGTTLLKSSERYKLILEKFAKREELIALEYKYNNKKIKTNTKIQELKKEGIKADIIELLVELRKKELLIGDDAYLKDSNTLKIGKLGDNTFSYEIKIKSTQEIIEQVMKNEKEDVMIPLSEYLNKQEAEKKKEENKTDNTEENKTDNTNTESNNTDDNNAEDDKIEETDNDKTE